MKKPLCRKFLGRSTRRRLYRFFPVRADRRRRMTRAAAAAAAALVLLVLGPGEAGEAGEAGESGAVTCGSVVKLLNPRHGVRLHSHDVRYGSGKTRVRRLAGAWGGKRRV